MPMRGVTVLAIVTGGIALGAALGTAADPEMKQPPERRWQGPVRGPVQAPVAVDAGYQLFDERPDPYESYAPSWAHEELTDWEPDYPAWTYSDLASGFGDDVYEDLAGQALGEQPEPLEPETLAAPEAPPEPDLPSEPQIAGNLAALY